MITVITGMPGAGKTLCTLYDVHNEYSGKRKIYYCGIPELKLEGWTEFQDCTRWHELPEGSVIVVDEAQTPGRFPARGNSKTKPDYIAAFETHRHRGHDVYLITQDAMLIDHVPRKLCEAYIYYRRVYKTLPIIGVERYPTYMDRRFNAKMASRSWRRIPKSFFDAYKSASLHTVVTQSKGWKAYILLPLFLIGVPLTIYMVFSAYRFIRQPPMSDASTVTSNVVSNSATSSVVNGGGSLHGNGGEKMWVTMLVSGGSYAHAVVEYESGRIERYPANICIGRPDTAIICKVEGKIIPYGRPLSVQSGREYVYADAK